MAPQVPSAHRLGTTVLYSDYIGPACFRLNLPEVAPVLKRVWHPWSNRFEAVVANKA